MCHRHGGHGRYGRCRYRRVGIRGRGGVDVTKRKHTNPTKISFREGRGTYRSANANKGCAIIVFAFIAMTAVLAVGGGVVVWKVFT
jgi:hypothetical protein